jgi:hypothetical protein
MSCTPRTHEPSSMCDVRVRSLGRFGLAAVLLAVAPSPGTTQQPPQASPPTFASRIDLVTVDVVVVDKSGRPVRGLTPRDFEVEEDGAPQTIVSFEAVVSEPEPPAAMPGAPSAADASRAPRRVGRAFAVVLDDLGLDLSGSVETRRAVSDFLRQSLAKICWRSSRACVPTAQTPSRRPTGSRTTRPTRSTGTTCCRRRS